jgi:hypothetical protein
MADKIERIKFVADMTQLNKSLDNVNLKLQAEKDKVKEITKAIKELGKESGARKDLIIEKAQAEQNIKSLKKEVKDLNKTVEETGKKSKISWAGFIGGATAAIAVMGKLISMSSKEADSRRQVNFLYGEQGKNVIALASKLQKLTGVDNQVIQSMAIMGKTLGASNENIEKLITGAIGLEKAIGIDATSAMRYLTLAMEEGEYSMLNRYMPGLRSLETETEKQAYLNQMLGTSFDLAKDRMNTVAGTFETLGNTITDKSEEIGDELTKSFDIANKGSALNIMLESTGDVMVAMLQYFRNIGTNIGIFVLNAIEHFTIFGKVTGKIAVGIYDTFFSSIKGLGDDLKAYWKGDWTKVGDGMTEAFLESFKKMSAEIKTEIDSGVYKDYIELSKGMGKEVEANTKLTNEATIATKDLNEVDRKNIKLKTETKEAIKDVDNAYKDLQATEADTSVTSDEVWSNRLSKAQAFFDEYSQMIQTTAAIFSQLNTMEMQEIDDKYNAEKDKYNEMLENNLISKEQYDTAIQKLDNKAAEDKKKALKKQQKVDIAIATMNTAKAVISAFAAKDNVITWQMWTQAALAAALGATQIATIASQKFQEGGLLQGASHSEGGIPGVVKGRPIEMEGGEIVTKKEVNKDPMTRDIVNYAQALKNGRLIPGARPVKGMTVYYADGTSRVLSGSGRGMPSLSSMMFQDGGSTGSINPTGSGQNIVSNNINIDMEPKLLLKGDDLWLMYRKKENAYIRAGGNPSDI